MSFDLDSLREAISRHGPVARVVVADMRGSTPRETGAAMIIWPGGQSGTIGGGALEFDATKVALEVLSDGRSRFEQKPLGPALGQCCGGSVSLLTERWNAEALDMLADGPVARPANADGPMPLSVSRLLRSVRSEGTELAPQLLDGWMIEPLAQKRRPLWIYGAGHVGRALVTTLSPVPDFAITWIDTSSERFPTNPEPGVNLLPAADPALASVHAPDDAEHLILTYSHALDLELCHAILSRPFVFCGLIGSATKRARFRSRLLALGHTAEQASRITCPIGDPSLGKHPHSIALGVGAGLLANIKKTEREARA